MNSNSRVLNESEIEELKKALSKMGRWVILAKDVLPNADKAAKNEVQNNVSAA